MSISNNALAAASAVMAVVMVCSCVNEDYDLTRDIDKTVTIEGDINAPIGNTKTIMISDILDIEESGSGMLAVGENGDYSLYVSGDRSQTSFRVPTFSINKDIVTNGGYVGNISRADIMSGLGIASSSAILPTGMSVTRHFPASKTPIAVNETIPEEIVMVKEVSGKAVGIISLHSNVAKATVSGLSIKLPGYLKTGEVTSTDSRIQYTFNKETNTLAFKPTTVYRTTSVIYVGITGIDFDKIPAGQGFLPDSHLILIDDDIDVSDFDLQVLSDDIGSTAADIPEKVSVDLSIRISAVEVESATIKADPKIDIRPMSAEIGTLPSFMRGEGTVLDLYNPLVMLRADNGSPLPLTVEADLESIKGNDSEYVHVGGKDGSSGEIRVNADGTTNLCLSRTGEGIPDGYTSVLTPDLSDIVRNVPERIGFANTKVKAADEYITVYAGMDYDFSVSYDVLIPLAFGDGLRFEYSTDFTGWSETFSSENGKDYEIRNANLTFDFVNMIPLGFGLSASAIDRNGDIIPEIRVNVDGAAAPGSIGSPSRTQRRLSVSATSGAMGRMDGIRLFLSASEPDREFQGICLNKNQGIRLENMKLSMQGSITTEL